MTAAASDPLPEVLRISAATPTAPLGGAIAAALRQRGAVRLETVGLQAQNQAVKGLAVATSYLISSGMELACTPYFIDIDTGTDAGMTGIGFRVWIVR